MKNPAQYIRQRLYGLLNGNLMYDGEEVPVFESEGEIVPYQVIITDYSDSDSSNKRALGGIGQQLVEVQSEQPTASKAAVDEIGAQVMSLIQPSPVANLTNNEFQVFLRGKPSLNHQIEDSGDNTKITRLFIRYTFFIQEIEQ